MDAVFPAQSPRIPVLQTLLDRLGQELQRLVAVQAADGVFWGDFDVGGDRFSVFGDAGCGQSSGRRRRHVGWQGHFSVGVDRNGVEDALQIGCIQQLRRWVYAEPQEELVVDLDQKITAG